MKNFLFGLLLTFGLAAQAQVYNNEWIDYSKTYYKFKVGKNGLFRIPQNVLANAGLGATPAEHFQLWRNGQQVPIYTSVPSGVMGGSDFIEFWGRLNDGKPDKELYRQPDYQLNDKWSLETDTSVYYLTVHTNTSENLRLQATSNDVASNTLPAEPYFMHKAGNYFRHRVIRDTLINGVLVNDTLLNQPQMAAPRPNKDIYLANLNPGYAINVGTYLYSSSYDKGEGWSSYDITSVAQTSGAVSYGRNASTIKNLYVYNGGPDPYFTISLSGNAVATRRYKVTINEDSVIGNQMDFFNYRVDTATFALSTLSSGKAIVTITNLSNIACYPAPVGCQTDRIVVHKYEIVYPRMFNFGGQKEFEFPLPASSAGNYLEISNFNYGATAPVLYDLTNGTRYVADLSAAPLLKFALLPSASARELVLLSTDAPQVNNVGTMQTRNFTNYAIASNQGDYLIITNPVLYNGTNGANPVNDYKTYRRSAPGGSYNAQVYPADELVEQFGFGIKKNPAALRNFIHFALNTFTIAPKHVFIIGKGVNYVHQRSYELNSDMEQLNLVPTYGWPASDVLLASPKGSSQPSVPIGRLSAITGVEVETYLKKIKEYEQAQVTMSGAISDRGWMKNIVHIVGASEAGLETQLTTMLDNYGNIISDTLFGANVTKFSKSSSDAITQVNSARLTNLFSEGISLMTYFGHSSSTTLEFNLDNPENYNNHGKYPIFLGLGCNVGDFFKYSPVRLQVKETLSEKYVLAPDRGMIAMIASTHFGIVHYLDVWSQRAYKNMASRHYGKTIGEMMQHTAEDVFAFTTQEDFYARCNTEQSELHGDPAIHMNPHAKPDYAIEDHMARVTPGFVSVADHSFRLDASFKNIGKAVSDSIVIEVKRQIQNQAPVVILRDTIPGIRYVDSIALNIPINPNTDKGLNKLTITVDLDNDVDEFYENNNVITKEIFIYEDEARPVFPYNFAIVNHQDFQMQASTANPFSPNKEYQMEIDTTQFFNSPLKVTRTTSSAGGVISFNHGMSFSDSTVYYWRVAPVVTTGTPTWNMASFIYLPNSETGFNQSHYQQQIYSTGEGISFDANSKLWKYGTRYMNLFVRQGTWVSSTSQEAGLSVAINGVASIRNTCWFQSVVFNVFDPITFAPWINTTTGVADAYRGGKFGSAANNCSNSRRWNFEYRWDSLSSRKRAVDFLEDTVPDGAYVVVRSFLLDPVAFPAFANMVKYANQWRTEDEAAYGAGNSLYHTLKNAGFSGIDSFYRPRQFVLVYKKNDPSFTPKWIVSEGVLDNVTLTVDCPVPDTVGFINSPQFGPALAWKTLKWRGTSLDQLPGDNPKVSVIGIRTNGQADTLMNNLALSQQDVDISSIDAAEYPYVQLRMRNADNVNNTPYQLRYWRLTYEPAPEGAIAANSYFSMKDTVDVAEPLEFKIAFKNVSATPFSDSIKVKAIVTDRNNVQRTVFVSKHRPLAVDNPDTLHIRVPIDTRDIVGPNSLYVEINPDFDQPEQYLFNNFAFRTFYVRGDTLNPVMDVTFDNVHILNRDIVSSKPNILITLKDEAKWHLLNDPSKLKVQVRQVSTGLMRDYQFDADTLSFVPAQQGGSQHNTASAIFKPYFEEDGEYELIVTGKDMSDNEAGRMQYRVNFQVINKPMISNMLNYPNPFTTSTAFVFTVTGSQVPQNIRIQILTVTGKVVKEITKEELGPIHIGRNITEYKWDGTDQYGQKLANGVYLYRVITNLNGKSLDKYTSQSDNTDKYFNKGYGKMYLMR